VNPHVYLKMFEDQLVPCVNTRCVNTTFGKTGVTLQQDGSTSHTANHVQEWCKKNMDGFWSV